MLTLISAFFWVLALYGTYQLAAQQQRSPILWCIGGVIFTPFASVLVLAVLYCVKNKSSLWK